MPSGSETIATNAERRWNRKTKHTSATTMNSSTSLSLRLSTARSIRLRAVVGRHDLDALAAGSACSDCELRLHRFDGLERVLARAHHDDAAGDFAFAVELARCRAASPGPTWMRATSPSRTDTPASVVVSGILRKSSSDCR